MFAPQQNPYITNYADPRQMGGMSGIMQTAYPQGMPQPGMMPPPGQPPQTQPPGFPPQFGMGQHQKTDFPSGGQFQGGGFQGGGLFGGGWRERLGMGGNRSQQGYGGQFPLPQFGQMAR